MHNITCFDEYGNVVYGFTQWDLNQKIYIEDLDFATTPSFHFQNKNTTRALVVTGEVSGNGMISADVPNQLLVEPYPISVYVYMADGSASKVIDNMQLPVRPRQQPNDFVTQDNIDLIALEDVKKKLEELKANIAKLGWHADNIPYDNTESGLQGTTVGDALDELANGLVFVDDSTGGGGGEEPGEDSGEIQIPIGDTVYLYNEGVTADICGDWTTITDFDSLIDSGVDVTYIDYSGDYIEIHKDAGSSGSGGVFRTGNQIDFSAYSTLHIEVEGDSNILNEGIEARHISLSGDINPTAVYKWSIADYDEMDKTRYTTSVNISDLTTNQGYLQFGFSMTVKQAATIKIHKIWIEKAIAGHSDSEKVSNAKEVIEEAINNMTVTNDTTQADIQTVVDNALSNAGITDVTATVQNVSVTEATSSATGTVTGNVAITFGSASDSVSINKTISKLRDYASELNDIKPILISALNSLFVTSTTYSKYSLGYYLEDAVANAGYNISEIYISTSSLTRTASTVNTEGSITGDLNFGFYDYGEKGVITGVNVVIPKLTPDGLDTEYLYYFGNECKDVTNGWTSDNEGVSGITCNKNSGYLEIVTNNASNDYSVSLPSFTINQGVRLSYDKTYTMGIEYSISGATSPSAGHGLHIGVADSGGMTSLTMEVDYSIGDSAQYSYNTISIQDTEDYTISVYYAMPMGTIPDMNLKIYRVWYMQTT